MYVRHGSASARLLQPDADRVQGLAGHHPRRASDAAWDGTSLLGWQI